MQENEQKNHCYFNKKAHNGCGLSPLFKVAVSVAKI